VQAALVGGGFPGLEPVYRVVILLPRGLFVVFVDGVTGEVLGSRRWHRRHDVVRETGDAESL